LVLDDQGPLPPFDVHYPLLSLPLVLQTTLETIPCHVPYVRADAQSIAKWRQKLADGSGRLKVGLAWAGNRKQANDYNRSMTLADMALLGQVAGVDFYSLQKGEAAQQAANDAPIQIVDWTTELGDFADTAAFIQNLDLVISVDTSVAHLAGALGKPVWTLLSFAADWRYHLEREDSPWYPSMRLFRQPTAGDWKSVVHNVAEALKRRQNERGKAE
jgi:ADP-heptose:LPS heptosyltransferase